MGWAGYVVTSCSICNVRAGLLLAGLQWLYISPWPLAGGHSRGQVLAVFSVRGAAPGAGHRDHCQCGDTVYSAAVVTPHCTTAACTTAEKAANQRLQWLLQCEE